MRFPKLIPVFYLLLIFLPAFGANPFCDLKNYSYEEGLSNSSVTGILQDQRGLMWFSTWNGLSSFDGYKFRNFRPYPGDGCTMMNSRINKISLSAEGDIWCVNQESKAYLFDVKRHKFIDVLQNIEERMHQNFMVRRVTTLSKGVTWIICDGPYIFRINDNACKESSKKNNSVTAYGVPGRKQYGSKVIGVFEDSDGDEWIMTENGPSIVGKKKIRTNFPFHFIVETNKTIWLATTGNLLARFLPARNIVDFISIPKNVRNIYTIQATGKNELALGTDQGLLLINTINKKIRQISVRIKPTDSDKVEGIYKDSYGDYWLTGSYSGVIHISGNKTELLQSPFVNGNKPDGQNLFVAFEDQERHLWIIPKNDELCYYDRNMNLLKTAYKNIGNQTVPVLPLVGTYFLDRQNNLWCGSNKSLNEVSIFYKKYNFSTFRTGESDVRAIRMDKSGRIWAASKDGRLRVYSPDGSSCRCLTRGGILVSGDAVFGSNVYDIMEDISGNIWLGTKPNGLFLLKPDGPDRYSVSHYVSKDNDRFSLSGSSVYSIYQDNRKRIWAGTFEGGLNLISKDAAGNIRFINCKNFLKDYPIQIDKGVRYITQKGDVIMLATTNGLLTFSAGFASPEKIHFFRNSRMSDVATSLSGNDVMYIFTDCSNKTYVITQNAGLNLIVSSNLLSNRIVFKVYNERNGLASDLTRTMIEDRSGKKWLVSRYAITRFDPQHNIIDNYGSHSFMANFMFSEAAVQRNQKGEIIVGTSNGLFQFDPSKMKKGTYVPPIIFTEIKIQGKDYPEDAERQDKLVLKSSQRNLIIQFAALDYQGSDQIKYSYKLDGVDDTWHEETTNRSAEYLNLPHGKFRFMVRSTNSEGAWVNNMRTLNIVVRPTFRETPWFWLLMLILFGVVGVVVFNIVFTIYRLRHEVDIEQQLSDVKLKFFTDISHELRTPLTLIAGPLKEVVDNEPLSDKTRQNLSLVQKNVNRLLLLINQILDFRKIQSKRMKMLVEETDIIELLRKIMDNFRQISEERSIGLKLETTSPVVNLWIDRDKFEKIIFNLLSNAFKYSPDNKDVSIKVETLEDRVIISVSDKGIGIPENKLGTIFKRFEIAASPEFSQYSTGIGLSLVKELVELHHGSIEVSSKLNKGSEFRIYLLKGRDHFIGEEQTEFILSDEINSEKTTEMASVSSTDENPEIEDDEVEKSQIILVVEDNKELLQFLKDILSKDFRVVTSPNGQDGLKKAFKIIPDMIVSDVMMPVMDGLEMIRRIKDDKSICHIPIIILSAKDSLDDRITGLESGIDDYISKPFSASYLRARIKSLLAQRKYLQEAFLASLRVSGWSDNSNTGNVSIMPSDPKIANHDESFVQQILSFMEENMDNATLTVDDFALHLSMSRTVFYKKIKSLFGVNPVDLIKDIRIKRSVQLIKAGGFSFSEIAYMCGFNDPNYFGKCFKKIIGITPSEYKDNSEKNKKS